MSQSKQATVTNTIHELRQAKSMVEQVMKGLESQKTILKQRGMNLPPMVLHTLRDIRKQVSKLESTLVEEHTELGQLRALAEMSANITTSLDVNNVLDETMDIVIALTGAERGYVILVDDDGAYTYPVRRENTLNPTQGDEGETPEISTTVLSHVIDNNEPLLTDNAFQDDRVSGGKSIHKLTLRSVLCVPLTYKDDVLGAVYVDNRLQAGIFSEREKATLKAFANTAAVALANAQLFQEIQQMLSEITQVKDLMDNVFQSIGSGLIATDDDDHITVFNRAAENILEIPQEKSLNKPLQKVIPRVLSDLNDHLETIRQEKEVDAIEAELTTKEGNRRALSMKLSPLRDSDSNVRGVAVVMDDVTQKRESEQQLLVLETYLPKEMVDQIHEISQLALGGVRREVTCMFAEVRSLATLKDVRPSEIMSILNEYLSVATDCVHETQGVVDKYMGTEVMAMWNTQLRPVDNHAQLALDCALLMRDRFIELYQKLDIDPEPHYYRIGMHSGVATLGNVGSLNRRDFTAIGDTINLSKRLEENSVHGQIIISEETRQYILSSAGDDLPYRFESLPPMQVKGRQQKTQVYEVFRQ